MKTHSDKKYKSSNNSTLQFIDVHRIFIERTQVCKLSSIGRNHEYFA